MANAAIIAHKAWATVTQAAVPLAMSCTHTPTTYLHAHQHMLLLTPEAQCTMQAFKALARHAAAALEHAREHSLCFTTAVCLLQPAQALNCPGPQRARCQRLHARRHMPWRRGAREPLPALLHYSRKVPCWLIIARLRPPQSTQTFHPCSVKCSACTATSVHFNTIMLQTGQMLLKRALASASHSSLRLRLCTDACRLSS